MIARLVKFIAASSGSRSTREFAQVVPGFPVPPPISATDHAPTDDLAQNLNRYLISQAEILNNEGSNRVATLIDQYHNHRGREIRDTIATEPHPNTDRRIKTESEICPISLIAHVAKVGSREKICVSSGFHLEMESGESYLLTCAHTIEEIAYSGLIQTSGAKSATLVLSENNTLLAEEILSSLHRHDLLLLRHENSRHTQTPLYTTLPVSPYPAPVGTEVAAHFIIDHRPREDGWVPCFNGLLYRKWVKGHVVSYRDFAGNEAKPGTYDNLANMFITQIPTPGSSGGPIIETETGAVVGIIRGSRFNNRIEGLRGWATSAESIHEMFMLPGIVKRS